MGAPWSPSGWGQNKLRKEKLKLREERARFQEPTSGNRAVGSGAPRHPPCPLPAQRPPPPRDLSSRGPDSYLMLRGPWLRQREQAPRAQNTGSAHAAGRRRGGKKEPAEGAGRRGGGQRRRPPIVAQGGGDGPRPLRPAKPPGRTPAGRPRPNLRHPRANTAPARAPANGGAAPGPRLPAPLHLADKPCPREDSACGVAGLAGGGGGEGTGEAAARARAPSVCK